MVKQGRDQQGKFTNGNTGGPGRPKRAVEEDYLGAFVDNVSIEDWVEICKTATQKAKQGCHKSRQFIAGYLVGQPRKTIRLTNDEPDLTQQCFELMTYEELKLIERAGLAWERVEKLMKESAEQQLATTSTNLVIQQKTQMQAAETNNTKSNPAEKNDPN